MTALSICSFQVRCLNVHQGSFLKEILNGQSVLLRNPMMQQETQERHYSKSRLRVDLPEEAEHAPYQQDSPQTPITLETTQRAQYPVIKAYILDGTKVPNMI